MTDISKGRTLFLLSKLLVICLSTCHVVKREAPDGQLYVFSDREGCESVQSQAPCTVSWQLNTFLAKVYKQENKNIASEIQSLKDEGLSDGCAQAIENSLCSQLVPKCSTVDGIRDYGDVSKLCEDVYLSCPQRFVDNLKGNGFCQKLKTGKQPNSPCVAPSTPITGACPQPKYKMPSDLLEAYRRKSANLVQVYDNLRKHRYKNGERIIKEECISQLKEISCSPLYCSVNETQLLIKHDQDDCNKIITECFDNRLTKLAERSASLQSRMNELRSDLRSRCEFYPKSSTQLQAEPPTVTSAGNCQFGHPILMAAITYLFIKTYV